MRLICKTLVTCVNNYVKIINKKKESFAALFFYLYNKIC